MFEEREALPGSDGGRIDDLLVPLQLQRLRAMAAARRVETRGASRHELVQRLTTALQDHESSQAAVAAIPAAARRLLEYVVLWDGEVPLAALRGAATRLADGAAESAGGEGIVDDLLAKGLLLVDGGQRPPTAYGGGPTAFGGGPTAYLPRAARPSGGSLLALAPTSDGTLPPGSVAAASTPPLLPLLTRCWGEGRDGTLAPPAPRQVHPIEHYYGFLQGWHNNIQEVEALAGRGFGRWRTPDTKTVLTVAQPPVGLAQADRRRLMTTLGCSERQLAFAFRLLRGLGLIVAGPAGFVASSERMAAYLARPAEARLRLLAQTWIEDRSWSELFQVRAVGVGRRVDDGGSKQETMLSSLALGRRLIARTIGSLAPGGWYGFGEVLAVLRRLQPDLPAPLVVPGAGRPWFARDADGRVLGLETPREWNTVAGGFVARILLGPLTWLGAVELALNPGHGSLPDHEAIVGVRLTALGRTMLDRAAPARPEQGATGAGPACACLRLDEGLRVLPTDATPVAVHQALGGLALPEVSAEVTLAYRLAPERLEASTDVRAATAHLVALLEQHAIPPLPDGPWRAIRRWGEHVGEAALYRNVSVVEVADAAALEEVLAVLGAKALICTLSERSAVIDAEAVPALRGDLMARGYTPRLRRPAP